MTITKEEAIQKIKDGSDFSDSLFDDFRNDREVVLEAVKGAGRDIRFANPELRADEDIYITALKQDGSALEYLSPQAKADKTLVLLAIQTFGRALFFASQELKADKEVVLEAIKKDGWAFTDASEKLVADKELAIEAIKSLRSNSDPGKFDADIDYKTKYILREYFPEIRKICRETDKDPIEALEEALIRERKQNFEAVLQDKPAAKRKKTF